MKGGGGGDLSGWGIPLSETVIEYTVDNEQQKKKDEEDNICRIQNLTWTHRGNRGGERKASE